MAAYVESESGWKIQEEKKKNPSSWQLARLHVQRVVYFLRIFWGLLRGRLKHFHVQAGQKLKLSGTYLHCSCF